MVISIHDLDSLGKVRKSCDFRPISTIRPLVAQNLGYVLYLRDHRLCAMEEWLADHRCVLAEVTGWDIGAKEATDDRLGDLLAAIG